MAERPTVGGELRDAARATSGGFLFGIPLLYTMETWEKGKTATPAHMLAVLGATLAAVLLLDRTVGFRSREPRAWRDTARDAVEAVALGVVGSALVLAAIGQLRADSPAQAAVGAIVFASAPFALGVAIANHFLRGDDDEGGREGAGEGSAWHAAGADLGAAAIGAVFLAFNIAPTEEILLLATALEPPRLIAIVALSLLLSYAVVFAAGYSGQARRHRQQGPLQAPWIETVASYLVALVAAAAMLALFGRFDLGAPAPTLAEVIVLGLPAAIGGAAGRLAI